MKQYNKLSALESHIFTLRLIIVGLLAVLFVTVPLIIIKPEELTINVPPDLSIGATITPGKIYKSNVYQAGYYFFSVINNWKLSGAKEYEQLINSYQCYVTPKMFQYLKKHYQAKLAARELDRKRYINVINQYSPNDNVKAITQDSWVVFLDVQISEYTFNTLIKDVKARYPLTVVRDTRVCNQVGLSLGTYYDTPKKI